MIISIVHLWLILLKFQIWRRRWNLWNLCKRYTTRYILLLLFLWISSDSSVVLIILNSVFRLKTIVFYWSYSRIEISLKTLLIKIIWKCRSRDWNISWIHKWSWPTFKRNCMNNSSMICTSLWRLLLVKITMLMRSTSSSMWNWSCLLIYLFLIQKYSSLGCCLLTRILKLIIVIMGSSWSWNHLWWLRILMSLLCRSLYKWRLDWYLLSIKLLILLS